MNTKAERLEELKKCIEILEKELQACKQEIAIIDGTDDVVLDLTNSIYEVGIECLDFSVCTYNRLRRAGINTCRDLVSLSYDDLKARIREKRCYDEVQSKFRKLKQSNYSIATYIQRKLELQKQDFEMLPRFLCALKTYSKIRQKAKENNIRFNYLGRYGNFARWYKKEESLRIKLRYYELGTISINQGILGQDFLEECSLGKHPKMFEMLRAEEMTTELVKEAVIEDVTEAMTTMKKETKTYEEFLRFLKLIQEF